MSKKNKNRNVLTIFKIGNQAQPATAKELKTFAKMVSAARKQKNMAIVCHHAVSVEQVVL